MSSLSPRSPGTTHSSRWELISMFWEDRDEWGSWEICDWIAPHAVQGPGWACLLPDGHSGPHFGPAGWEAAPYYQDNRIEKNQVWVEGEMCYYCNRHHPGFRHADHADKVVIGDLDDGWWGPTTSHSANLSTPSWSELFVPTLDPFVSLPTPPKFATLQEADSWLEAHAP